MDLPEAHAFLVARLSRQRNSDGGWPYYGGRKSRLEPTCWAALGAGVPIESTPIVGWLNNDGMVVEPTTGQVNLAFNGLAALTLGATESTRRLADRIIAMLVGARGDALPPSEPIRQDNSLQGWPWTMGTFSWIEPTAWCMLALKRATLPSAEIRSRIAVAESIMRDRECKGGGWNSGTAEVFGKSLPAHVPPTAIGVMALQDRRTEAALTNAVRFLEVQAVAEGSTTALALSTLALACIEREAPAMVSALVAGRQRSVTFGNVAAIGMAAYALDCAINRRPPAAFALPGPL